MDQNLAYDARWLWDEREKLRRQFRKLEEVRRDLELVGREGQKDYSPILQQVSNLEISLQRTEAALADFQEKMDLQIRKNISRYDKAREKARHSFFS